MTTPPLTKDERLESIKQDTRNGMYLQADVQWLIEQLELSESTCKAALEEKAKLEKRVEELEKALKFYATGEHYGGFDDWDTVSGEPENWIFPAWDCECASKPCKCCEDRIEQLEIGEIAAQALSPTGPGEKEGKA